MEILNTAQLISKNPVLTAIFIPVAAYAISFIFVGFLKYIFQQIKLISKDFPFNKHFIAPIWLLLCLLGYKSTLTNFELFSNFGFILQKFLNIALIMVSAYLMMRITAFLRIIIFNNLETKSNDEFKYRKFRTQLHFIEKFTVFCICLAALVSILLSFDEAKKFGSSIIASAGLAGIILGFAAQKTLGNLIAGFQIAFTQPFKIGDTVVVDGEWGHIKEITLTYIVVKSWDKRNLIVPITYLLEKPFQNWTRSNEKTMGIVFLYVDYSLPVDKLRNEFMRLISLSEHWDGETSSLYVVDATEKTMQIRVLVSAKTADEAFLIKAYLRENLIKFIQQNYPQCLPKNRIDGCFSDLHTENI